MFGTAAKSAGNTLFDSMLSSVGLDRATIEAYGKGAAEKLVELDTRVKRIETMVEEIHRKVMMPHPQLEDSYDSAVYFSDQKAMEETNG